MATARTACAATCWLACSAHRARSACVPSAPARTSLQAKGPESGRDRLLARHNTHRSRSVCDCPPALALSCVSQARGLESEYDRLLASYNDLQRQAARAGLPGADAALAAAAGFGKKDE